MSNIEYYAELAIYRLTDYEWSKRMCLQTERIKIKNVKMLEKMVNFLKGEAQGELPHKKGKMIKLNPIINTLNQPPMKKRTNTSD